MTKYLIACASTLLACGALEAKIFLKNNTALQAHWHATIDDAQDRNGDEPHTYGPAVEIHHNQSKLKAFSVTFNDGKGHVETIDFPIPKSERDTHKYWSFILDGTPLTGAWQLCGMWDRVGDHGELGCKIYTTNR